MTFNRNKNYNQIFGESEIIKSKNDQLVKNKKKLVQDLDEAELTIRFYENKEKDEINYKSKLEELKDAGIINSN